MLQTTAASQRKTFSLRALFWLLTILLGALQAGANLYTHTADDIIAYLDIGDAYFRGEWHVAINAYWSPLYSWILALALSALKPSIYWEFPVVKLVNFLIYLFTLVSFDLFLRELVLSYNKILQSSTTRYLKIPEWVWIVSGYTLFLVSSLLWIGVTADSPDMLVAAFVYLAASLVLRIHARPKNWLNFIILGAVLGLSYLSKAVMFPIAFVFLVVAMFSVGNWQKALPRVMAALLVFTIITAPFITAISTTKGRLTFGDTGKLNYVWLVTGGVTPYRFWQGEEFGSGTPKHPPRQIFDDPKVFEFAAPVGGTYPPWHDPSYWYEGLKFKFNLERQITILENNTIFYHNQFLGGLIFSYLILVAVGGRFGRSVKDLIANWRVLIPAVAGLGIYMLVIDMPSAFMQMRYIAPFIVLLFAGVFSSVRLPISQETKRLGAGITVASLFLVGSQLAYHSAKNLQIVLRGQNQHIEWQAAEILHKLGVQPREKVAILGVYVNGPYHWARLARVKIVAEILDEKIFWEKNADVRSEVLKAIEKTGAKAIVQKPGFRIPDTSTAGWQEVGNTGYYVYFFQK